jgi:formate-dependent nitrite reductase cytochrome c552 subunit
MKRIIAAIALILLGAGYAAADSTEVVLTARNGTVVFPHKKHVEMKEMACTRCHDSDRGGIIAALGKEWAHKTCIGCHQEKKMGPTKCGECHKK